MEIGLKSIEVENEETGRAFTDQARAFGDKDGSRDMVVSSREPDRLPNPRAETQGGIYRESIVSA